MRVVCINDKNEGGIKHPYLKYGSIYEAAGEATDDGGSDCYLIPGFPPTFCDNGKRNSLPLYKKSRFIPLSDIDEKEMEREWMLTPVELPNQVN